MVTDIRRIGDYNELQRDFVFRVWAFEGERKSDRVAALLASSEDAKELGVNQVSGRSIRNWVKEHGWDQKANEVLYKDAPALRFRTQTTLILGAPEAAQALRDAIAVDPWQRRPLVISGKVQVDEDGVIQYEEYFDVNIYKAKIGAAIAVLDRTGFNPVGVRETGRVDTPPSVVDSLTRMVEGITDPEEMLALETAMRKELGIGKKT